MNDYLVQPYDQALQQILCRGERKPNQRTGTYSLWYPGILSRYDLTTPQLPAISRRKLSYKAVVGELIWFLRGYTRNEDLRLLGCNYWTPWVDEEWAESRGFCFDAFGPVYGFQLRHFGGNYVNGDIGDPLYGQGGFDQLAEMIRIIKADPSSRQNLWSLWHPPSLRDQRLPPCHLMYQVEINTDTDELTGFLTQRSCDFPVGVPANIMFYSLLTALLARLTGYRPKELVHYTIDSHIYENQIDATKEYLETDWLPSPIHSLPFNGPVTDPLHELEHLLPYEIKVKPVAQAPVINFPVAV